jgi:hypothetical protein
LTLYIYDELFGTDQVAICDSELPYSYGDIIFTEAGTKDVIFSSINGCDSTISVILNVNKNHINSYDISICDSELPYSYGDIIFTEAGTKDVIFSSINGCDSIITTNLTVYDLPNPEFTYNADTLTSVRIFSSYQWYDQDGVIPDAISNQYIIEKKRNLLS